MKLLVLVDTLASHHEAFRLRGAAQAQRCADDIAAREHSHQAPLLVHYRQPPDLQLRYNVASVPPYLHTYCCAPTLSSPSLLIHHRPHTPQPAGIFASKHIPPQCQNTYAYLRLTLPPTNRSFGSYSPAYCAREYTDSPPDSMHGHRSDVCFATSSHTQARYCISWSQPCMM